MSLFFGIVGTAYYGVIRAAEIKWPKIAWLLGALPVPAANVPPVTPTPPAVTIPPVASKG